MAGAPITQTEVQKAAQLIEEAALTPASRKQNTCGGVRLARMMGVTKNRGERIIERLRHPAPISTEIRCDGDPHADPTPIDQLQEQRFREETAELRRKLREALSNQVMDQRYQEFVAEVSSLPSAAPSWITQSKPSRKHQAMPIAHLSDGHFDEYVDPAQVMWVNAYSRDIAVLRLRRFFDKTIMICDEYLKGLDYPGIVMPMSGDMFSGAIHEELRETNEGTLCESLRFWIDHIEAGIKMLADRFGKVYIPLVVGNHPRQTDKPRSKGGVRDNFDWLLGSMLQRDFARANDKRVQFQISDSFDVTWSVYGIRYLQTHGDQWRGGSGIAGALSPMLIGDARKRERQVASAEPYDVMIHGHWHYRFPLPTIKGNGTLKGYDEYAMSKNLKFQKPQQSFWLTTPEHGITMEAPIYVEDPREGWRREQRPQRRTAFAA